MTSRSLAIASGWPPRRGAACSRGRCYQAARADAMADALGWPVHAHPFRRPTRRATWRGASTSRRSRPGSWPSRARTRSMATRPTSTVVADAGYRMMSPSHFFDNAFGGSAHGIEKGGLTPAGREMVERMEARSMLVDVAHASAGDDRRRPGDRDPAGHRLAHRRPRRRRQRAQPRGRAPARASPRPAG